MKTHHQFLYYAVRLCLAASLSLQCACQDEIIPAMPEPVTEGNTELSDAYHDKIRTQPYPKTDNELYLNPPPLIIPQSMKTGETLQFELSQSEDFNATETQLSEAKAWCMFNPHRKLHTGTWYWRFRNIGTDRSPGEWSDTYSFEVKDETPAFVTPAFSEFLDNAPRRYPRLYCYLDPYIDEARCNIKSHREYKLLLNRAQTAIDADYSTVNPNEHTETLKSHVQYLYDAYHLTQQYKYQERMHGLLKLTLTYPVSDRLLFASNFSSSDIAICYATLYDQLYHQLSPDERTGCEELMLRVLRHYTPKQYGSEENHIFDNHFWQQNMRVLFQCCLLLYDNPDYSSEVLPMMEYYYELWTARAPASGFNRDGVWHNGSGYFNANLKTLHYMPMIFSYITRKDFLQHPWYKNAGRSMVYTWPPRSKSNGFGDGSEKGDEPVRMRVAFADFLARELNDSYAGWYASECNTTLYGDPELRLYRICADRKYENTLPADASKMIWYKDAGEVAMHSDLTHTENNVNLSFRSGTFGSGSHTTSSQNAFNLLYKGKEVYRSSGYYLNFSDAHNLMSYRHSRAHNTILVNGIGQPYSTKAYGNVMRAMEGRHITYCLGDASNAYNGVSDDPMWIQSFENAGITQTPENGFGETPLTKYRRHVLMLHPEGIILIYDELEASEPVTYDWLLHSPSQMYLNQELLMVNHENREAGFTAVTQLFCNSPLELSVNNRFVVPPTPIYNPAYPNQWHVTARTEKQVRTLILAVIQINDDDTPTHIIKQNGNAITVGKWSIHAELDAAQPATLTVTHADNPVFFSLGNAHPIIGGNSYLREQAGSSMLYDEDPADGEYKVSEMTDRLPASTRAASY